MSRREVASCAVQNQFTAYLIIAIHNYKRYYLRKRARLLWSEIPLEEYIKNAEELDETAIFSGLSPIQHFENERLFAAIQALNKRERCIHLSRVLEGKSLSEIAEALGISYGAVAMSYHRTVARLRRVLGGTEHD